MSRVDFETNALLGAYLHEAPLHVAMRVSDVLGRVAAEQGMAPDEGIRVVDEFTRSTSLPFASWRVAHVDGQPVQDRIALQRAYAGITSSVEAVDTPLARLRGNPLGRPLGSGHSVRAYLLREPADDPTVIKVRRRSFRYRLDPPHRHIEGRLQTLLPGKNIPGYEQAKAIQYADGSLGVSYLDGQPASCLKPEAAQAIPDGDLEQAVDTVEQISNVHIVLDTRRNNVNHSPETGLGFYDALRLASDTSKAREANVVGLLATLLTVGVDLPRKYHTAEQAKVRRELAGRLLALHPELSVYLAAAKELAFRRIAARFKLPVRHFF